MSRLTYIPSPHADARARVQSDVLESCLDRIGENAIWRLMQRGSLGRKWRPQPIDSLERHALLWYALALPLAATSTLRGGFYPLIPLIAVAIAGGVGVLRRRRRGRLALRLLGIPPRWMEALLLAPLTPADWFSPVWKWETERHSKGLEAVIAVGGLLLCAASATAEPDGKAWIAWSGATLALGFAGMKRGGAGRAAWLALARAREHVEVIHEACGDPPDESETEDLATTAMLFASGAFGILFLAAGAAIFWLLDDLDGALRAGALAWGSGFVWGFALGWTAWHNRAAHHAVSLRRIRRIQDILREELETSCGRPASTPLR